MRSIGLQIRQPQATRRLRARFLRRLPHRARALEVLKMPDSAAPAAPPKGRQSFRPAVVGEARGNGSAAGIPMLGQIAAGVPIEAIQSEVGRVQAPEELLGSGEHFALEVKGDSMIQAGILDGDVVLIKRTDTADSGVRRSADRHEKRR